MAQFLKNPQLNSVLDSIFENASKELFIISPFIKLHASIKDALRKHLTNEKIKIIVVFGKNEDKLSKSFSLDEFTFLKEFPNIEIKYEYRLHAKYYANESMSILSSMNLYEYSQNNNIEFGILTETTLLNSMNIGNSLDKDAFDYFDTVIKNSQMMFQKVPEFESKRIGKKYIGSNIVVDNLTEVLSKPKKVSKQSKNVNKKGYCIRTGIEIAFDPKKPFCDKAYASWSRYKDENYKEKFCHFSGEEANGETTFSKPILRKNWKKSQNK